MHFDDELIDDAPAEQDVDAVAQLGAITAASYGDGIAVVHGEYGHTHVRAERDDGPSDDLGAAQTPREAGVVNAGVTKDTPTIGAFETPREDDVPPERQPDEDKLSHQQLRSLMRHGNTPQHVVNEHGQSVPAGGGGGGGRKKTKPHSGAIPVAEPEDTLAPPGLRLHVTGLTAGEHDFYERRGIDVAMRVLRTCAEKIAEQAPQPEPVVKQRGGHRHDLFVYGLSDLHVELLRLYPGAARLALSQHARNADGGRVAAVDEGHRHRLAERMAKRR